MRALNHPFTPTSWAAWHPMQTAHQLRSLVKLMGVVMLIRAGIRRRPETWSVLRRQVRLNCKQKFTPDLPGAVCSSSCAIAYAVSVNGTRKVAQVKGARRPRPRWRSSRLSA
jgi:hypothetical protein